MTNDTIYQFAMKVMSANTFEEAKALVTDIILAVNMNGSLIDEAIKIVNEEFMKAVMSGEASNQSELN
jgi:hypothetical protein